MLRLEPKPVACDSLPSPYGQGAWHVTASAMRSSPTEMRTISGVTPAARCGAAQRARHQRVPRVVGQPGVVDEAHARVALCFPPAGGCRWKTGCGSRWRSLQKSRCGYCYASRPSRNWWVSTTSPPTRRREGKAWHLCVSWAITCSVCSRGGGNRPFAGRRRQHRGPPDRPPPGLR